MTKLKQPSSSPLALLNHEFTVIELRAEKSDEPTGELALTTAINLGTSPEDELKRFCELTVQFGPADENKPASYNGKISIVGVFRISENYPEHRRDHLMEVSATSILYGACREMLANLTARSVHGLLSLPSVSFFAPDSEAAKKVQKTDKKRPETSNLAKKKPPKRPSQENPKYEKP